MIKGGTQLIECSLDQLYYGIFRDILRGAQNKKASSKTNKNRAKEKASRGEREITPLQFCHALHSCSASPQGASPIG